MPPNVQQMPQVPQQNMMPQQQQQQSQQQPIEDTTKVKRKRQRKTNNNTAGGVGGPNNTATPAKQRKGNSRASPSQSANNFPINQNVSGQFTAFFIY